MLAWVVISAMIVSISKQRITPQHLNNQFKFIMLTPHTVFERSQCVNVSEVKHFKNTLVSMINNDNNNRFCIQNKSTGKLK